MKLSKLNPWNWFKHEDQHDGAATVPIKREEFPSELSNYSGNLLQPMLQLHREMDRWFDEAFRGLGLRRDAPIAPWRLNNNQFGTFTPQLNVASDDEEYVITLEAPGLTEKDLQIELQDRRLLISGNKQEESENRDRHFYRIERRYGSFQRVLALPDDAAAESISAAMKNGVLSVRIPRRDNDGESRQRISIQAA